MTSPHSLYGHPPLKPTALTVTVGPPRLCAKRHALVPAGGFHCNGVGNDSVNGTAEVASGMCHSVVSKVAPAQLVAVAGTCAAISRMSAKTLEAKNWNDIETLLMSIGADFGPTSRTTPAGGSEVDSGTSSLARQGDAGGSGRAVALTMSSPALFTLALWVLPAPWMVIRPVAAWTAGGPRIDPVSKATATRAALRHRFACSIELSVSFCFLLGRDGVAVQGCPVLLAMATSRS